MKKNIQKPTRSSIINKSITNSSSKSYNLKFLFSILILIGSLSLFNNNTLEAKSKSADFDLGSLLHHHLMDSVIWELHLGGERVYNDDPRFKNTPFIRRHSFKADDGRVYKYSGGFPMHITRRVMQMLVISIVLLIITIIAARTISRNPLRISGRFGNIIEAIVQWCQKDILNPCMSKNAKSFSSYILSLFLFILFLNLGGLLPPIGEGLEKLWHAFTSTTTSGGHELAEAHDSGPSLSAIWPGITVTGDISVTLALALITTLMIWITGFRFQGIPYLWRSVPNGVPLALYPILLPLEFIISPLAKGFALTIRLLANMTAGHVIILALMGFIFQSASLWYGGPGSMLGALSINFAAVSGAVIIYFLEILVAFLQAFIFVLLTALFIGSALHRH